MERQAPVTRLNLNAEVLCSNEILDPYKKYRYSEKYSFGGSRSGVGLLCENSAYTKLLLSKQLF